MKYSFVFLLISTFSTFSFASDELTILSEVSPPVCIMEGKTFTGPLVKIVQEIQKRVRHNSEIQVLPWNRAYHRALTEENIGLFPTTRTPEREKLFQWVCPLHQTQWAFYALKTNPIKISSLDDAKRVNRIGTYLNDAKDEFLKTHHFNNVDTSLTELSNAMKLSDGRIDLWFTSDLAIESGLRGTTIDSRKFKMVYNVGKQTICIAFSLKTPKKTVTQWQKTLDQMIEDGTVQKLSFIKNQKAL